MSDTQGTVATHDGRQRHRVGVVALLALSIAALAAAPTLMPESYSPISLSVSESAAQGVEGAWLARTGFLLYGFAVLWLSRLNRERWGRWGQALFGVFGVMMVAAAAYSHRPWIAGAPTDVFEDLLHTVAATGMGFAFAAGVIVVAMRRQAATIATRLYDSVAVAASFVLPLVMLNWTAGAGALQRLLFLIAFGWYALETLQKSPAGLVSTPTVDGLETEVLVPVGSVGSLRS